MKHASWRCIGVFPLGNLEKTVSPENRKTSGASMNTTIKDAGLTSPRESAAAAREGPGVAEEASRREFDRLYGRAREADPEKNAREDREESLSSLMSSLFDERLGATVKSPAQTAQTAPVDAPRTEEMVERLVAQILVSDPSGDQTNREVRLMVRDSLLPDTEIRLARGADGLLRVTLATDRSDAFQTLVAAQTELKAALDAREKQEVRLIVTDRSGAEDGERDRRSQGYQAYAPDAPDEDAAR
jgi:type III secretion system needle length determinant